MNDVTVSDIDTCTVSTDTSTVFGVSDKLEFTSSETEFVDDAIGFK